MRGARATVATLLTLLLATAGHGLAGGDVSSAAVLTLVVFGLPLGLLATRWQWTWWRAVAALGVGQVGVHGLLTLMSPTTGGYAVAQHVFHTRVALPAGSTGGGHAAHLTSAAGLADHAAWLGMTPTMLAAHAAATVVAAWLIARGERTLWRALARLLPLVSLPRFVPTLTRPARPTASTVLPQGPAHGPHLSRGPPAVLVGTC